MQEAQVHVIPCAGVDLPVHPSEVDDALWVGDAEEPSGRLLVAFEWSRDHIAFECNLPLIVEREGIPPSWLAIKEIQISFSINLELNQNDVISRSVPFDTIHSN